MVDKKRVECSACIRLASNPLSMNLVVERPQKSHYLKTNKTHKRMYMLSVKENSFIIKFHSDKFCSLSVSQMGDNQRSRAKVIVKSHEMPVCERQK